MSVCMCAGLEKHHVCVCVEKCLKSDMEGVCISCVCVCLCREMMFKKQHGMCVCVCTRAGLEKHFVCVCVCACMQVLG